MTHVLLRKRRVAVCVYFEVEVCLVATKPQLSTELQTEFLLARAVPPAKLEGTPTRPLAPI